MAKKISEKQNYLKNKRKEEKRKNAKAERKKKKKKKIVITSVSCVAAIAIVSGAVVWGVKTKPFMHGISAEKTEHYKISPAEMSFYAWQIYQRFLEDYSENAGTFPDSTKPLSEQSYDDKMTWEEYFADAAKDYANNILILCEAAFQENYTPSEDVASVSESIIGEFDKSTMPECVRNEDIQHAMELYLLAWDYSEHINEEMTFTDEELETYYQENAKTMQVCDYMYYSFGYDDTGTNAALTKADANEYARELRRCTTQDDFEEWVYTYLKENTTLSDDDLDRQITTLAAKDAFYTNGNLVSEWAFSGEIKAGESTILDDSDNSAITVCLMLSEPKRDESNTISLRQILFTANTYGSADEAHQMAEEVMMQYQSGIQNETSFGALADQYTEDTSASGGLYTNVRKGDLIPYWREWYFDPEREYGDTTILDSSYGSAVAYFVEKDDEPIWITTAKSALQSTTYEEQYEDMKKDADVKISDFGMKLVQADNT